MVGVQLCTYRLASGGTEALDDAGLRSLTTNVAV